MKFYIDNIQIPVTKCKKPKFSTHRGRTWDFGYIMINNEKVEAHLDTTWGQYIYFQFGKTLQLYKVPMFSSVEDDFKGKKWDIDPFSNSPCKIEFK